MARRDFTHLVTPGRLATALAVAIFAWLLAWPAADVAAQECPFGFHPVNTPRGWYPDDLEVCGSSTFFTVETEHPDDLICRQQLKEFGPLWPGENKSFLVLSDHTLSNGIRIKFVYMSRPRSLYNMPERGDIEIIFEYFSSDGTRQEMEAHTLDEYQTQERSYLNDAGLPVYYWAYYVDELIATPSNQSDGMIRITFDLGTAFDEIDLYPYDDFYIASLGFTQSGWNHPDYCDSVGPTATPTPGDPPTEATPTPWPTSDYVTPNPTATPTPIVWPTVPARATATPWDPPSLSPIIWPTVDWPAVPTVEPPPPVEVTVESGSVIEERSTRTYEMAGDVVDIATRWAEPIDWAAGSIDPGGATGSGITGTVPVSTTAGAMASTVSSIAYPFRFLRSVKAYMPNTWRALFPLFLVFLIVFGVHLAKFAVTIISEVLEVIRRLWDALPLT